MSVVELPSGVPTAQISFTDPTILNVFKQWFKKSGVSGGYIADINTISEVHLIYSEAFNFDEGFSEIIVGFRDAAGKLNYRTLAVSNNTHFIRVGKVETDEKYNQSSFYHDVIYHCFGLDQLRHLIQQVHHPNNPLKRVVKLTAPDDKKISGTVVVQKQPMENFLSKYDINLIKTENLSKTNTRNMNIVLVNNVTVHMTNLEEEEFLINAGSVLKDGGCIIVKNPFVFTEGTYIDASGINVYQKVNENLVYRGSVLSTGYDPQNTWTSGGTLVLNRMGMVDYFKYFRIHFAHSQGPRFLGDYAMSTNNGGIDLNPAQMSLQVKRDENFSAEGGLASGWKFDYNGIKINASQVIGATFNIETDLSGKK
jgi:hypothetical protein